MSSDPESNSELSHHIRFKYCRNRPLYRKSKKLTAVKVYSVANESRHLLVFGVPQIKLLRELKNEFQRYGTVQLVHNVTESIGATGNFDVEAFTDVFHVKFEKLEKARRAKKFLDAKNFYGGILHISYAPERETIEELREKLQQRRKEVRFRIHSNHQSALNAIRKRELASDDTKSSVSAKRMRTA
ncbi:RNA-binding protein 48 [Topomyia yanbarensis]|uniref:RNA-binding protein 48 n=1 Tax=Topomyia yanbarensis TaxID=2498891 RepID=UPI00273AE7BA|nr:RNA-binding protein 48 [Topomyia yanbarensis]